MEEDEVDDAGFPIVINDGDDDEALVCAGEDHRVHTCIESGVRVVPLSSASLLSDDNKEEGSNVVFGRAMADSSQVVVREIPLSRGMIGRDGTVRFRIDLNIAFEGAMTTMTNDGDGDEEEEEEEEEDSDRGSNDDVHNNSEIEIIPTNGRPDEAPTGGAGGLQVVKLIFRHVDTGAVLELRLPSKSDIDGMMRECSSGGGIEFCGVIKPGDDRAPKDKDAVSRYLLDDSDDGDEDDDDEPNEYKEDGFLVNESQDSDSDEGEFDSAGEQNDDVIDGDDDDDDDADDNDGECRVCKKGGELIVCDGGDHHGGCGHMYHVHCIGRTMIPPGKRMFPCISMLTNFSESFIFNRHPR
jgi:hypothetical protein